MKLAIIGASLGQVALYRKAKELGHVVIAFAWNKGVLPECRKNADRFYPISVVEVERIVEVCRDEHVDGVVSNGSELLAEVVAKVSTALGLHGNSPDTIARTQDKLQVRRLTNDIDELIRVECCLYGESDAKIVYPCVVKPLSGSGKRGVSFVTSPDALPSALEYAQALEGVKVLVEGYVGGREVSVESISYEGRHQVVQITDKVTSGAPHFVELAHHQPSTLPQEVKDKIKIATPKILTRLGITNGATHTEFKIRSNGDVALIEVNPRGGGDEISSTLVGLSTNCDYVKAMIDVALGFYQFNPVSDVAFSGICFICEQTKDLVSAYMNAEKMPWFVSKQEARPLSELSVATGNYDRNGYVIYRYNRVPDELKIEMN